MLVGILPPKYTRDTIGLTSAVIREHVWYSYSHLWDGAAGGGINFMPFLAGVGPGWGSATYTRDGIYMNDKLYNTQMASKGDFKEGNGYGGLNCLHIYYIPENIRYTFATKIL